MAWEQFIELLKCAIGLDTDRLFYPGIVYTQFLDLSIPKVGTCVPIFPANGRTDG